MSTAAAPIEALVFDKDGTLFDFAATWAVWAERLLVELAEGDRGAAQRLGAAIDFDLRSCSFAPQSVAVAGTPEEIATALATAAPDLDRGALLVRINAAAAAAPMAEAVPLRPLLMDLRARGLHLGVATNDAEAPARAHIGAAGVEAFFGVILGSDSGYGAKPEPGQLLHFARAVGTARSRVAMVGDSTHDLLAGRAAGMVTIAVLTGLARHEDLAPHADVVLPDIGHVPDWLDGRAGRKA